MHAAMLLILATLLAGCASTSPPPLVPYPLGPTDPNPPADLGACRFGIAPATPERPAHCVGG